MVSFATFVAVNGRLVPAQNLKSIDLLLRTGKASNRIPCHRPRESWKKQALTNLASDQIIVLPLGRFQA